MNPVANNRIARNVYPMRKLMITVATVAALAGCTTTEKDVSVGAAAGAIIGGIADGGEGV